MRLKKNIFRDCITNHAISMPTKRRGASKHRHSRRRHSSSRRVRGAGLGNLGSSAAAAVRSGFASVRSGLTSAMHRIRPSTAATSPSAATIRQKKPEITINDANQSTKFVGIAKRNPKNPTEWVYEEGILYYLPKGDGGRSHSGYGEHSKQFVNNRPVGIITKMNMDGTTQMIKYQSGRDIVTKPHQSHRSVDGPHHAVNLGKLL